MYIYAVMDVPYGSDRCARLFGISELGDEHVVFASFQSCQLAGNENGRITVRLIERYGTPDGSTDDSFGRHHTVGLRKLLQWKNRLHHVKFESEIITKTVRENRLNVLVTDSADFNKLETHHESDEPYKTFRSRVFNRSEYRNNIK